MMKILLKETAAIVKENKASETIIIGESKDYKGNDNLIMEKIAPFKKELEALGIKVILRTGIHDEFCGAEVSR
jgi:metallophosphoesterase superfamily enzyme